MRVLVVEDEQLLADAVATGLRREAMAVDVVYDGAAALERIGVNDYDVVVLDRDLPLVHGDDVCRKIVELGMPTRVLMLTASGDVSDRVEGLEIGADDYLPKPFAFSELIARVRALGRRTSVPLPPVLERAGIKLDPNRREVFRDGNKVAQLGAGTSVGEMAYLAPSPELRRHSTDVLVSKPCTTISFTPETLEPLSPSTRHLFDGAFIKVLARRLHAAHEAIAHPRRIL